MVARSAREFNRFLPRNHLARGLALAFDYFRARFPRVVSVRASEVANGGSHAVKTAVGWALGDMSARGFLVAYSKKRYLVAPELARTLARCEFRCARGARCELEGTPRCPFRVGEVWRP